MDDHAFAALAGTWRGTGAGSYPTIESFTYLEELVVEPVPERPVAHWRSRTRDAAGGGARHAESGFLRTTPSGVELVVAHSFGTVEVATGAFGDQGLDLSSIDVRGTPSAKRIDRIDRHVELGGTTLSYTVAMAAVGLELTHHLQATLARS